MNGSDDGGAATPYALLGGREPVLRLAARFYEVMERDEPALAALHQQAPTGGIAPEMRDRFALFLVGWLGGPQEYMARHGHPRLRMRHAHVRVDTAMRDAWVRCMETAMNDCAIEGPVRLFLEERFAEVAGFLRNQPD